ncbi:hypothetical protein VC34_17890 [Pseudomonas fluorescens]|uniref:Uncharacterized protein n=1 Tax=Pseudomonas fluorescens TaxID=294 RepID=A0A0F4TE38_PSEFL|nr:hypothetical protein VC34_17890 [Pseudomonas fluorescens]
MTVRPLNDSLARYSKVQNAVAQKMVDIGEEMPGPMTPASNGKLRGKFDAGFSYLPCHTLVTTTLHNAASQKDLTPSTESPAKCRVFSFHRHAFHETLTERSAD